MRVNYGTLQYQVLPADVSKENIQVKQFNQQLQPFNLI